MTLNYKSIPFKTEWIEYCDIEMFAKRVGAPPTAKRPDGSNVYTSPFIYDSSTNKAISDSGVIVRYLEDTYSSTPQVFPIVSLPGSDGSVLSTKPAISMFESMFMQVVYKHMEPFMLAYNSRILLPRSEAFHRRAREKDFGCKLKEMSPAGSTKRAEDWRMVKQGLEQIANILDQNTEANLEEKNSFFLGDVLSYADIVLASWLLWMKIEVEPDEWAAVAAWNGGRWEKLLGSLKALYQRNEQ